jgi:hypothetical protein
MTTFPAVIDSTMLAALRACERRFAWAHVEQLQPATSSIHLHAGGAFAAGLETARRAWLASQRDWLESGLAALWERYGDRETDKRGKDWLTLSHAYLAYWDEWPPDGRLQIEEVEATFALQTGVPHPHTGEPILYAGRIDWIGRYQNTLWAVDEKTTSAMGESWASQWRMRSQLLGYVYALRSYGFRCAGAVVRGIYLGAEPRFCETMLMYPDWELERWFAELQTTIRRAVASYQAGEWVHAYGDACYAYGGCPYSVLCSSANPDAWRTEFVRCEWNPLERSQNGTRIQDAADGADRQRQDHQPANPA